MQEYRQKVESSNIFRRPLLDYELNIKIPKEFVLKSIDFNEKEYVTYLSTLSLDLLLYLLNVIVRNNTIHQLIQREVCRKLLQSLTSPKEIENNRCIGLFNIFDGTEQELVDSYLEQLSQADFFYLAVKANTNYLIDRAIQQAVIYDWNPLDLTNYYQKKLNMSVHDIPNNFIYLSSYWMKYMTENQVQVYLNKVDNIKTLFVPFACEDKEVTHVILTHLIHRARESNSILKDFLIYFTDRDMYEIVESFVNKLIQEELMDEQVSHLLTASSLPVDSLTRTIEVVDGKYSQLYNILDSILRSTEPTTIYIISFEIIESFARIDRLNAMREYVTHVIEIGDRDAPISYEEYERLIDVLVSASHYISIDEIVANISDMDRKFVLSLLNMINNQV